MPSYRVTLTIGALRPGVSPQTVLPTAADAAATLTTLEASDLSLMAGSARVTIRFTADDAEIAKQIGEHVASVTAGKATVVAWRVTERKGSRWAVVP